MNLSHLALFQKIVELGSLAAAARHSGLSSTTVSERLATLEAHYGATLLNRTTRAISLTDEGRILFEGTQRVLDEAQGLETRIRQGTETLSGPIRISAPHDLGRRVIAAEIDAFQALHPEVTFELLFSDGYVDVVGEGIDIALRFGSIADSTLRIRSLGTVRRVVCAAPDYIDRFGAPETPADLRNHACLIMRFGQNLDNQWHFGTGAQEQVITVSGRRVSNDGYLVRQWCVAGVGIALKSALDVSEDLRCGRLIELLPDFSAPAKPLQMMFPPSRSRPRRTRLFAEHLIERLKKSI